MSDIEQVVTALHEHGPTAAATVAGLWAAKRVAEPSLNAIGARLGSLTTYQMDNVARIFAKAEKVSPDAAGHPHPRVASKVLNDASLYDDDVMQTYTAGLIAGSRNEDGSDDRPIYYLSLMDSLTAGQLTLFHTLYTAAVSVGRPTGRRAHDPSALRIAISLDQVHAAMAALGKGGSRLTEADPYLVSPLSALDVAGLLRDEGTDKVDEHGYTLVTYWITRAGMLLFDWAHGYEDESIVAFYKRDRSQLDLPELRLDTAREV